MTAATRPRRVRRCRRSPVAIGAAALLLALVVGVLSFTKDIPFTSPFELRAVFASASSIRPGAPVRIAGVDVGTVAEVAGQPGTNAAVVTLRIDEDGLPLHTDATAKIRPRIFLEGNFFVDLRPGSPGAPELADGATLKITQTASPVQLDEVLTALQSDSRQDLQDLLDGLATALRSRPTRAQDAAMDPLARGQSAAESLNDAYGDLPAAERSSARVLQALLGTQPSADLSRLLRGGARTTGALARNENALQGLIVNLNATTAALASRSGDLRASIRLLAPTLRSADGALSSLDAALAPTRAFAREILPGVRETPATIAAALPWIAQARRLVSGRELGGLAGQLAPAAAGLARLSDRARRLLPQADLAARCVAGNVLPTGDMVLRDEFTTGVPNYKEFVWSLVGLAGEGANFDGNGPAVRFQTGGGSHQISVGRDLDGSGQMFGNDVPVPLGNRPVRPGRRPPYRPDVPCHTQKLPEVNGPAAARTPPGGTPAATAATRSGSGAR